MDICIKNPMDECTHDCSGNCPQSYKNEEEKNYDRA